MNESPVKKMMSAVASLTVSQVGLFSLIVAAVYYFMFYDGGATIQSNIEASEAQLAEESAKKIETQKVLTKEQQMRANVQVVAQKFEEIKSKIPLEFTESELRSMVDRLATQSQLRTVRSDRSMSEHNFADKESAKLISQVSVTYSFEGSYAQIAKFVMMLNEQEKLIMLGDFKLDRLQPFGFGQSALSSKNKKKKTSLEDKVNPNDLSFTVSIYGFQQSFIAKTPSVKMSPSTEVKQ